jgi:hypothetical protein
MLELNRSIRSEAEWCEHVSACKGSGMTGVEYTRVHGLNVKSFYNARRRLGSRSMGDGPSKPELFKRVEVTGEGTPGEYRIRFPSGVVVEVGARSDIDGLKGLLQALGDYL